MWILHLLWYLGSTFVVVATLFSWLPHKFWWMRICDFPRMQIFLMGGLLVLIGVLIVALDVSVMEASLPWMIVLGLLLASVTRQGWWVIRMTALATPEVPSGQNDRSRTLRVIASNVDYTNTNRASAFESLIKHDPDLLALIEADDQWEDLIEAQREQYPYQIHDLQKNGKGIALLSKLPILGEEIQYLVTDDRPSIWFQIQYSYQGDHSAASSSELCTIGLCVLHPPPPGLMKRTKDERLSSTARDRELVQAAKFVADSSVEHWVMFGDFNDVGWSHTTEHAKAIGDLRDPRIGRGMYSTFPGEASSASLPDRSCLGY